MTNRSRVVLYTGVTNDLARRVWEHQNGTVKGFTKQYQLTILVYHETYQRHPRRDRRARRRSKVGVAARKNALVETLNPKWADLSPTLFQQCEVPLRPSADRDDKQETIAILMKRPFRGLGAILFKEFIVVLRDPMTLFFMLFPPLIEMIAFGYALDNDVKHMAMVVFNEDRTVESRQLLDRFVNTETFRIVREVGSAARMASEIRAGHAYVGLQIPPHFTRELRAGRSAQAQLLIDGSNSTTALQALNTAVAIALTQSTEMLLRESGRRAAPVEIRPQMLYNPTMRSPNFFVPGVIGIVLQIGTTFATAMAVVRERERGTLEQLLVSPLSRWGLMLGKLIPYLCIGMLMAFLLFAIMHFVFLRADRRERRGDDSFHARLRFRPAQPRSARRDQGREPDAGAPDVDDLHPAERFLLRLHFPARNDAVDFLRARRAPADHLFHRPDARDHSARRDLFRIRVVVRHSHRHGGAALLRLRAALPEKDRQ